MTGHERDEENGHRRADDVLTLSRKRAAALEDLRALREDGWVWSERTANLLVNPHDNAIHVWYDPRNGNLLFSPKVVEMMQELLLEEGDGGALDC